MMPCYRIAYSPLKAMASLAILFTLFAGCSADEVQTVEHQQPHVTISGINVPKFQSPAGQLAYARSSIDLPAEKRAALLAVSQLFPDNRLHSGLAHLELAYLKLGIDYRFSSEKGRQQSLNYFSRITRDYKDIPAVVTKAIWYLGWIYCDLLGNPAKGLPYFHMIVSKYPKERLRLQPPAPWLSIAKEEEGKKPSPLYAKSTLLWADLARLEIIRNTDSIQEAEQALFKANSDTPHVPLEGVALKLFITRFGLTPGVEKMLSSYSQNNSFSPEITKDLSAALRLYENQNRARGN